MPSEFETNIEEYPEMDPEAEGEEAGNSDARPVSSACRGSELLGR
jgi:hypothetical protein